MGVRRSALFCSSPLHEAARRQSGLLLHRFDSRNQRVTVAAHKEEARMRHVRESVEASAGKCSELAAHNPPPVLIRSLDLA